MEDLSPTYFNGRVPRIFMVRHAEYDRSSGALTPNGIRQIEMAGESIYPLLIGDKFNFDLCASFERRAIESAWKIEETIAKRGAKRYGAGKLDYASDLLNFNEKYLPKILEELSPKISAPNIVMVGHKEVAGSFLGFCATKILQKSDVPRFDSLEYGQVAYLDLRKGEYKKLDVPNVS